MIAETQFQDTERLNWAENRKNIEMIYDKRMGLWTIFDTINKYQLSSDSDLRNAMDKSFLGLDDINLDKEGIFDKKYNHVNDRIRIDFLNFKIFNKIYWDNLRNLFCIGYKEVTTVASSNLTLRKTIDKLLGLKS